ncbi:MAG: hypothetical protein E7230_05410 [Clostridiales bacterium]|nr:hypothetical protein [Clostridiales bacterium]
MRTLMMIASFAMIGSGIFCVANGSAAFLSVAFVIGAVFVLLGAIELLISRRADFDVSEKGVGIAKDGALMLIVGLVILTGQVTDDMSAQVMFALWLTVEGVLAFKAEWFDIMETDWEHRIGIAISTLMLIAGVYIFFNNSAFRLSSTLLTGICMIVLGLRRFWQSLDIEYSKPSFVTGNEEKLREAQEDEKRALAKAKEGIREQKSAQRRIAKIKEDMAAEQDVMMSAAITRQEREAERELEE